MVSVRNACAHSTADTQAVGLIIVILTSCPAGALARTEPS